MTSANHFVLLRRDGQARTGKLTTPHGVVRTPAFMPVETKRVALRHRTTGNDATDLETGGDNSELYDRRLCPNPAQGSHLKRPMIPQRRSQDLARCLFGTVAMPRRSPDRPEAGRAYQVDNAAGAIPNARVSLAMDVSGAPSGNRSSAANPAVVMLAALMCSWRHSSKASR